MHEGDITVEKMNLWIRTTYNNIYSINNRCR
jgi:hypothetical protein